MIEQTIKCDVCHKEIEGDHFVIQYYTELGPLEPGVSSDYTYESGTLQVDMKCFDLLRSPLNIDGNPQKEHQERLARERADEEARLAELAASAPEPPQERQEPQEIATREEN